MTPSLVTRNRPVPSVFVLAGIAFSAAWVTALVVGPSNLSVDASGDHVVAAIAGHQGAAIAQFLLAQGVAAAALAAVAIALGRSTRGGPARRRGQVAMAAGIGAAAVSLVQLALGLLLSVGPAPDGDASRAHLLFEAINRLDGVKMLLLAAMAAAGGALALSHRVMPRWLGFTGAALSVALVASAVGYLLLNSGLAEAAYVSLPLLLIWVTGTGIALGRAERDAPRTARRASRRSTGDGSRRPSSACRSS
jgi:hypothetical protein